MRRRESAGIENEGIEMRVLRIKVLRVRVLRMKVLTLTVSGVNILIVRKKATNGVWQIFNRRKREMV